MKALIIYEDFASAVRANATLHCAVQGDEIGVCWNVIPWRVDLLKFSTTADEALAEALDAHLIVFAGRSAQLIPAQVQNWLERWAKRRRIVDAALAVIPSPGNDGIFNSISSELLCFATRNGLNLIFDGNLADVRSTAQDKLSFAGGMKNGALANPFWGFVQERSDAVSAEEAR